MPYDLEYHNAMDRESIIPMEKVGASTNPFQHQTEALKARIFHGASRIEFSFFGQGKSNKEQPSPESFGRREREDMRALAEFNKVKTTTHATVGITGLSGYHQNSFNDDVKKNAIDELKRAIDFASEASTGGAVVFHTGEAPRSMYSRWKNGEAQFWKNPEEKKEEEHYLVDPISQQVIARIKENEEVAFPIIDRDKNGNMIYLKDENGNDVVDDILGEKIPQYKIVDGNIQTEIKTFEQFRKAEENKIISHNKNINEQDQKKIIKDFFRAQQMKELLYMVGQAKGFERNYTHGLEQRDKIIKALNFYKELKENIPEEDWWKYKETIREHQAFIPGDAKDPVKYLKEQLQENEKNIGYGREVALSGRRQAKETLRKIERSLLVEDYAHKRAVESMEDAAMYALEQTEKRIRLGDKLIEKNPLYISPESVQPESYGSHPDELKVLVQDARKNMSEKLQQIRGYSKKKADDTAKNHIRATLDIGHMNIWKRHFIKKENESQEHYDKRFKSWVLDKSKDLVDNEIVGHVHLNDNYGYHDEHLTIGDGNAPIKEFLEIMKNGNVDDFIVEAGSFNPLTALPDSLALMGSSVYSIFRPGISEQTWSDGILQSGFHQTYFGRTEGPRYIMGDYSPSEDFKGSPFYTGVPLE